MRNKIVMLLTAVICFILQSTVVQMFDLGDIIPNLLVVMVVSFSLMRGGRDAMYLGFIAGILCDLYYGPYLGIHGLLYTFIGYVCGFAHDVNFDNNIKVPMILSAGADLILGVGMFVGTFLFRGQVHFGYYFVRIILPEMIYTVFVTALLYRIFYLVNYRLMKQERKERDTLWLLE